MGPARVGPAPVSRAWGPAPVSGAVGQRCGQGGLLQDEDLQLPRLRGPWDARGPAREQREVPAVSLGGHCQAVAPGHRPLQALRVSWQGGAGPLGRRDQTWKWEDSGAGWKRGRCGGRRLGWEHQRAASWGLSPSLSTLLPASRVRPVGTAGSQRAHAGAQSSTPMRLPGVRGRTWHVGGGVQSEPFPESLLFGASRSARGGTGWACLPVREPTSLAPAPSPPRAWAGRVTGSGADETWLSHERGGASSCQPPGPEPWPGAGAFGTDASLGVRPSFWGPCPSAPLPTPPSGSLGAQPGSPSRHADGPRTQTWGCRPVGPEVHPTLPPGPVCGGSPRPREGESPPRTGAAPRSALTVSPVPAVRLHDSISEEGFHYLVFDL